jgi:hypothetical protein
MTGVICRKTPSTLTGASLQDNLLNYDWGYLQENAFNYDKGVLAEILEPIMGKGLIPADLETWKPRRRAIVPAFHRAYLEASVRMFNTCTHRTIDKLEGLTAGGPVSTITMLCLLLTLEGLLFLWLLLVAIRNHYIGCLLSMVTL